MDTYTPKYSRWDNWLVNKAMTNYENREKYWMRGRNPFKETIIIFSWHFDDNRQYWNPVLLKVDDIDTYSRDIRDRFYTHEKNHPLVDNRIAYWKTCDTLCIGYTLKSNPKVFRPIFSPNRRVSQQNNEIWTFTRRKCLWKVLYCIPTVVREREKSMKIKANITLLQHKTLPVDIINHIMDFL